MFSHLIIVPRTNGTNVLVRVVPHHICDRLHVCSNATHRLVRILHPLSLSLSRADHEKRNVVSHKPIPDGTPVDPNDDVYIGRSEVAMWMRVVSGWICFALYTWSLVAPVLMPDR